MDRVNIQGTPIDVLTATEAATLVLSRLESGERTRIAAVNAAIAVMASKTPSLRQALQDCDVVIADGKWAAVAAACLSARWVPHTNTSPFLKALFERCRSRGLSVFLLGARPVIVERAAERLPLLFPGIRVTGFANGYFTNDEEAALATEINNSGAELLLIGMTTPRKEFYIRDNWAGLNVPIAFGIGGLIDVWGGKTRESPEWIRRCGFEWLFRLVQEPVRLGRRYTVDNVAFGWLIVKQLLGYRVG